MKRIWMGDSNKEYILQKGEGHLMGLESIRQSWITCGEKAFKMHKKPAIGLSCFVLLPVRYWRLISPW